MTPEQKQKRVDLSKENLQQFEREGQAFLNQSLGMRRGYVIMIPRQNNSRVSGSILIPHNRKNFEQLGLPVSKWCLFSPM
jgi:hypothetical protein